MEFARQFFAYVQTLPPVEQIFITIGAGGVLTGAYLGIANITRNISKRISHYLDCKDLEKQFNVFEKLDDVGREQWGKDARGATRKYRIRKGL